MTEKRLLKDNLTILQNLSKIKGVSHGGGGGGGAPPPHSPDFNPERFFSS